MRAMTRLASTLLLLLSGPGWAAIAARTAPARVTLSARAAPDLTALSAPAGFQLPTPAAGLTASAAAPAPAAPTAAAPSGPRTNQTSASETAARDDLSAADPAAARPSAGENARFLGELFDGLKRRLGLGVAAAGKPEAARPGASRSAPTSGQTPSPDSDDGGGADYPYRTVRFNGQRFRAAYFRPNVPVAAEIVKAIDAAKESIHIALYEFKSPLILKALQRAKERRVKVRIILDESNVFPRSRPDDDYQPRRSREIWTLLRETGFEVSVLRGFGEYGINHNKIAVFDYGRPQALAIFGSYNWSPTAENSHYENANFTTESRRVDALMTGWKWLSGAAQRVTHDSKADDFTWPKTPPPAPSQGDLSVAFNGVRLPPVVLSPNRRPGESIEDRLAQAIAAAKTSVDVSIFALRSTKIAEALAQALKNGANVRLIMDQGQAETDVFGVYARWVAAQESVRGPKDGHAQVRTLAGPDPNSDFPIAQKDHHKFAILDGKLVETGSANYTKYAAAANFENAHFLDNPTDVKSYAFIFERMWKRAKTVDAPRAPPALPTDAELAAELDREAPAAPPAPVPEPSDRPKPRDVPFRGQVFPSFAFRPDVPIEPLIVKAVGTAKTSIRLALYEFTLDSVLDALRAAKKRGVKIEIVVDRSHVYTSGKDSTGQLRMPSPQLQALIAEGFDLLLLKGEKNGIQHNKFVLADAEDDGLVMFGSYNLARTAEDNHYENVKFSSDKRRTSHYLAYFEYMRKLAEPIDRAKLEETLARTQGGPDPEGGASDAGASPAAAGAGAERQSKFPPPPVDSATPIDLNGEKFRLAYFSPQGGIQDAWIRAIKAARVSIEIAMFSFYSRPIADALLEAQAAAAHTGLKIRLVLDAGQAWLAKFDGIPVARWFSERGFDVRLNPGPHDDGDPIYEKQHSKFLVVDSKFAMTGSFNLSDNAEDNSFENENALDDPVDIAGYVRFFRELYQRGHDPARRPGPMKPQPMPGA